MDHPHIIEFYETFEDERYIHIVMEYCKGGDLCDYIVKNSFITEFKAAFLFEKIFRAVNYLHNN
jgi:calcium-dependent protein kinase